MTAFPWSAFLIGLWSAGHCLAMCGGIAVAAGQLQRRQLSQPVFWRAMELLVWQLGRVASYSLAGLLVALFGSFFLGLSPVDAVRRIAFVFANLMLIGLGLHLAQVWSGIVQIERLGQGLWRLIAPSASQTLMPKMPRTGQHLRQMAQAAQAGILWGWLPCGLVYSMLVTASVSGSALNGALWMMAFGLGTLTTLWLTSLASDQAAQLLRRKDVRQGTGLLIVGFGLWGLLRVTGVITVDWLDAFCIGGGMF